MPLRVQLLKQQRDILRGSMLLLIDKGDSLWMDVLVDLEDEAVVEIVGTQEF